MPCCGRKYSINTIVIACFISNGQVTDSSTFSSLALSNNFAAFPTGDSSDRYSSRSSWNSFVIHIFRTSSSVYSIPISCIYAHISIRNVSIPLSFFILSLPRIFSIADTIFAECQVSCVLYVGYVVTTDDKYLVSFLFCRS